MIITGCQRSGTMSIANIFGIAHEVQFTPYVTLTTVSKMSQIHPEASWLVQPFIKILEEKKHKIIHLVRHPLRVIGSLVGIGFFDLLGHSNDQAGHKPYHDFVFNNLPGFEQISKQMSSIEQSMYYWIYWNEPLKKYPRINIETVGNAPQLNARNRVNIGWDDLPNGKLKDTLVEKATSYGYA